ncbi:PH domain-containing protein [Nonomuraea sp. NPDC055795]
MTTVPEQEVLPEQDGWRKLAGRSVAASTVMSVAIIVPVVVVLGRILLGQDWSFAAVAGVGALAAVVIMAAVAVYDVLRLRTTRWRLTGERLELRSGIAERRHRSVPLERVRSVDITADPVRRAFGLAVVKIGTGEHTGETKELTLDPLVRPEAEALRRTLLEGERPRARTAGSADAAVARLDWAWIRYAPLSIWTFVGGAIVAGALYKLLDVLGFDLVKEGTLTEAWSWVRAHPWLAALVFVGANAFVGLVGALGLFAETWGRYRLEREPGRLRLHRGLLTTRSLTLEERRLRGVEVAEPLLLRLGGGAKVKAVATGLRKAEDNETEDVAALTPPMPRELAWKVAAAVYGALPGEQHPVLLRHPRAAGLRRLRWAVAYVVVLAAAVGVLDAVFAWVPVWAWAVPVVALPVALGLAVDAYRGLGHGLGPRHLLTRSGSALRSTVALDRSGIVGWTVRQSYFQRRAGLLTVSATTAAGKGHYDVLDVAQDEGLRTASVAVPGLLEPFVVRR